MPAEIEAVVPETKSDRGLFAQIPLEVLHDPAVSHAAKLAYARLRLYAGRDGRCNPAQETLAAEVCLSSRQVRTVLSELRARGWITWKRRRTSCWYDITGPVSDRKKSSDPDSPDWKETSGLDIRDRKKTAGEIGSFPPVRSEENFLQKDLRKEERKESDTHTPEAAVMRACVRVMPRAPDLASNDPPGERFEEAWAKWPLKVEKDAAARAWLSVVTQSQEEAVFTCIGRYLASDQVARAVVAKLAGWLFQQHRDGWAAAWPPARSAVDSRRDAVLGTREERRQAAIEKSWQELGKNGTSDG